MHGSSYDYLKKQPSKILNDNLFQTEVTSFTKGTSYELTLSSKFVSEKDHVLIIDDFLANGEAATGAIRLIRKAHATIAGVGVLIEKAFQPGHEKLVSQGFDVYPLARISHMAKMRLNFWKIKPPLPQQGVLICPCSYKASAITLPV